MQSRGVQGHLGDPHLTPHWGDRQALAHQKNRVLFSKRLHVHNQRPQGHDTVPPEHLDAGRTRAPSSPAPGRRDPPPRPCPAWAASATGASSRPTAGSRASVGVVPAWARPLPPRVSSSLPPRCGLWAGMCGLRLPLPLSGGCCRTPAHLRDTRRGVTPRTFRQLPPRSLRLPCRERRESCRYHGVSGWGAPCSCPLSTTPTPP